MDVTKDFCVHLEFKDVPADHGCGYHVFADVMNEEGWPLDAMFTSTAMAGLNDFERMKRMLCLVDMQTRDGRAKRYQYLELVVTHFYCFNNTPHNFYCTET